MSEIATAETPTVETPARIDDSSSLSEHEAQFHGGRRAPTPAPQPQRVAPAEATPEPVAETPPETTESGDETRDAQGRFRKRAAKDTARPEDVPRIRELTKKLHELEAERDEWKTKAETPALVRTPDVPPLPAPVQPRAVEPVAFTDREPTIQDFANEPDPYAAYVRALARYDRKKEQFEADQVAARDRAAREEQERQTAADTTFKQVQGEYAARLATFKETHKDFDALLKAHADAPLPPLLQATVLLHDKGPALVYHLLRHPAELAEMTLLTDGKAVNDQNVAIATRWLTTRAQAAPTGSTAPSAPTTFTVPRPPNPVQTGPMSTGEDLPDDTSSLAAHEDAFTRSRRNGRRR